ncbi:MAG: hypothetical protein IKJ39_10390 [Lachnospiraceae bacterium]|nr:hypothetical protein [Lachnospiraceae bacterium]
MRIKKIFLCFMVGILLSGCGNSDSKEHGFVVVEQIALEEEKAVQEESEVSQETALDETLYIGEYLDENKEPNLEIAKGEDGKYKVQIGIFRLASFDDGMGELTEEGMHFTATDMAGDPIRGIITVENGVATVTFTDSTWEYIENGASYEYTKSSDEPRAWE